MPDKKTNTNEPLNDQQMENVSGGEIVVIIQPMPHVDLTCKCGRSFSAPCSAYGEYQCPVCGLTVRE